MPVTVGTGLSRLSCRNLGLYSQFHTSTCGGHTVACLDFSACSIAILTFAVFVPFLLELKILCLMDLKNGAIWRHFEKS
jgi:hypothetical protein